MRNPLCASVIAMLGRPRSSVYIRSRMASSPEHLAGLNPSQLEAAQYGTSRLPVDLPGPLLIIAGAGTGKTNTLAHCVAHLIVRGADPRRILLLTFSRRAAENMTRRVEGITAHVA